MVYDTDEEQIEALKSWAEENGTSLIIGIFLVLAVLCGSRYWQSSREATAAAASDIYVQMSGNVLSDTDLVIDDQELASAVELHTALKENFSSSVYSRYSALLLARLHVQRAELAEAANELRWVLDNPGLSLFQSIDDELELTTRSRLARVLLAQGDAEAALDLLNAVEPGTFAGTFADIKGDAYVALGRLEEAREAYQTALDLGVSPDVTELKLNDISS